MCSNIPALTFQKVTDKTCLEKFSRVFHKRSLYPTELTQAFILEQYSYSHFTIKILQIEGYRSDLHANGIGFAFLFGR
jgi:hypothetical protein